MKDDESSRCAQPGIDEGTVRHVLEPAPASADMKNADTTDAVTAAQRALDALAVSMYTYVGVVQRDAPPASRAPDDQEETPADESARRDLAARAPEYVAEILQASDAVAQSIERVREEVEGDGEQQRKALLEAENASVEAGKKLKHESRAVESLLERVRHAICLTEQEVS